MSSDSGRTMLCAVDQDITERLECAEEDVFLFGSEARHQRWEGNLAETSRSSVLVGDKEEKKMIVFEGEEYVCNCIVLE